MPIYYDFNSLQNIPQGQAISYVSNKIGVPCETVFLAAAYKKRTGLIPWEEKVEMSQLARSACLTQNPDIIWQIFSVESSFRVNIVNIGGKVLTGAAAVSYVKSGLKKNENIDIGPLQINWRANGSKFKYSPEQYLKGDFSVQFLSHNILKNYVSSCKENWINCYHSGTKDKGDNYRKKINAASQTLRKILSSFLS